MNSLNAKQSNALEVVVERKIYFSQLNEKVIFSDFLLTVKPGEFVSILGPSGCGKSTLLRMIAGLDLDYDGNISLESVIVKGPSAQRSLVFQQPRLLPWMTVSENVGFSLGQDTVESDKENLVNTALEHVGLKVAAGLGIHQLSGGMKTRVALARAIAKPPKLLLLDEPFSALDYYTRESILNNIQKIQEIHRPTTIMVTHDLNDALVLSDRIVVLSHSPAKIVDDFCIGRDVIRKIGSNPREKYYGRLLNAMELASK